MLDFRTCPETRDYGGREEIVLSAVVCGALEGSGTQIWGQAARGHKSKEWLLDLVVGSPTLVRERHQDDINVFLNRIYSTPHFLGNSCQSDRRRTGITVVNFVADVVENYTFARWANPF